MIFISLDQIEISFTLEAIGNLEFQINMTMKFTLKRL